MSVYILQVTGGGPMDGCEILSPKPYDTLKFKVAHPKMGEYLAVYKINEGDEPKWVDDGQFEITLHYQHGES